ncbi:MAG: hypothetical protein AABY09_03565, partial [Nanoarchaeota archaeon]
MSNEGKVFAFFGQFVAKLSGSAIDPNHLKAPKFDLLGDELTKFLSISQKQVPVGVKKLDYYAYNFCKHANSLALRCVLCSVPRGMEIGGGRILTKYKA